MTKPAKKITPKKESKVAARKSLIKKMKGTEAKAVTKASKVAGKAKRSVANAKKAPASAIKKTAVVGTIAFKPVDTTSEAYIYYIDFIKDALAGKLRKPVGDRQRQSGAQIKRARAALRSLPQKDVVEFIYGG